MRRSIRPPRHFPSLVPGEWGIWPLPGRVGWGISTLSTSDNLAHFKGKETAFLNEWLVRQRLQKLHVCIFEGIMNGNEIECLIFVLPDCRSTGEVWKTSWHESIFGNSQSAKHVRFFFEWDINLTTTLGCHGNLNGFVLKSSNVRRSRGDVKVISAL